MNIDTLVAAIISLVTSSKQMTEAELNSACRQQLDYFVFDLLKKTYGKHLQDFWNTTSTIPKESDKAIVIVERRAHPNLEFCIQNAAYFCRGYALHIFCSEANLQFVKHVVGAQLDNVHIHIVWDGVGTASQGYKEYNELLKMEKFWNSFQEEHIITLETDCYFTKPLLHSIYDYDYVASHWPWLPNEPGGGGLTYRKRSVMLEICKLFEGQDTSPAQDVFASEGIKKLGAKFACAEESLKFFTECTYSPTAIGTHQWWTYCISYRDLPFETFVDHLSWYLVLHI